MTNGPFFPKTTAINFTIQNTSPQKKRISIFGYPIDYGFTRDLLAIPEITESIIRESLIKGELYDKISRKDIVVISSTINLLQFDASQKAFLASAGITTGLDNKTEIVNTLTSMNISTNARTAVGAGAYTVQATDGIIAKTAISTGGDTVTLPDSLRDGRIIPIKDESLTAATNPIIVTGQNSHTIDGGAAILLNAAGSSAEVYSDGTNWFSLRRGVSSGAILTFFADFTKVTPGDTGSNRLFGAGMIRASSNATVRTALSTNSAPIAANNFRIYSDGTNTGLLIEEARTNVNVFGGGPRAYSTYSFADVATVTPNQLSPDGTLNACRAQIGATHWGGGYNATITLNKPYVVSQWMRGTNATSSYQANINTYVNSVLHDESHGGTIGTNYLPIAFSAFTPDAGTVINIYPLDARDLTAYGGIAAAPIDVLIDMMQVEQGSFLTSFTIGARAPDLLFLPTSSVSPTGKLALEIDLLPSGSSTQYSSDQAIAYCNTNNKIILSNSTRQITVTLNGASSTLPVAIPAFNALDAIKLYVESGGGIPTHAWVSINGTITDLGTGLTQANWPSSLVYVLNDTSASVLSCVVTKIWSWA